MVQFNKIADEEYKVNYYSLEGQIYPHSKGLLWQEAVVGLLKGKSSTNTIYLTTGAKVARLNEYGQLERQGAAEQWLPDKVFTTLERPPDELEFRVHGEGHFYTVLEVTVWIAKNPSPELIAHYVGNHKGDKFVHIRQLKDGECGWYTEDQAENIFGIDSPLPGDRGRVMSFSWPK